MIIVLMGGTTPPLDKHCTDFESVVTTEGDRHDVRPEAGACGATAAQPLCQAEQGHMGAQGRGLTGGCRSQPAKGEEKWPWTYNEINITKQ